MKKKKDKNKILLDNVFYFKLYKNDKLLGNNKPSLNSQDNLFSLVMMNKN